MSYRLACQLSHRIAAIASVGGQMSSDTPEDCNPLRAMPMLHSQGTNDTCVYMGGSTGRNSALNIIAYWVDFNGFDDAYTLLLPDLDSTDGCTVQETPYINRSHVGNIIFDKVRGGGHTWPGADTYAPGLGVSTKDINAGVEILNFFKKRKNPKVNMANGKTIGISPFCLYSNPVNDLLTIRTKGIGICLIEITSLNGKMLSRNILEGTSPKIDFSTFQK